MSDYIKRLRPCLKWFQELEVGYVQEQERLRVALESAERRLDEIGTVLLIADATF